MHPAGVLFLVGRDVSAGDGVHTYSCVRYAKPAFMRHPWRIKALPRRPWRCISVVLSIILQTLSSFAMRSRKSTCARRPLRLRPLRCGKMCGVTCAHRWPVLTSCYAVVKGEVCGRGGGYTVSGERIAKLSRYC